MARIPTVTREDIPKSLQDVFDEVVSEEGGIGTGPMSILKNSPEMAKRTRPLFNYVRNESTVPKKLRELGMLLTARAMDCPCIWHAHFEYGRKEGLSDILLDAIRDKEPLPPVPSDEAIVIAYSQELLHNRKVTSETFSHLVNLLGKRGLVELTTLLGFYTMLAFNANAVDLQLPEHFSELPLPT